MNLKIVFAVAVISNLIYLTIAHVTGLKLVVPLVPVWLLQGKYGLITAGLAGAALLKIKAGAATVAYLALRDGINTDLWTGVNYDSHGHGLDLGSHFAGHAGHFGGGGGGYRKKRNTAGRPQEGDKVQIEEYYDPSYDDMIQFDQLGCGLRLVCELSATPHDQLLNDEKLILNLFGNDLKAPDFSDSKGKLSYSYAALLGRSAIDTSLCSRIYNRCPYNSKEVMASLRAADV